MSQSGVNLTRTFTGKEAVGWEFEQKVSFKLPHVIDAGLRRQQIIPHCINESQAVFECPYSYVFCFTYAVSFQISWDVVG